MRFKTSLMRTSQHLGSEAAAHFAPEALPAPTPRHLASYGEGKQGPEQTADSHRAHGERNNELRRTSRLAPSPLRPLGSKWKSRSERAPFGARGHCRAQGLARWLSDVLVWVEI
jgi:hypothetical protein